MLSDPSLWIVCFDLSSDIINVNCLTVDHSPAGGKTPTEWQILGDRHVAVLCHDPQGISLRAGNESIDGVA